MEAILLDTMFELPALDGVRRSSSPTRSSNGNARPLYIYAEREQKRKSRA
jgi:ATP-dependent Clp protease ATP-binding subunit ClpX